MVWVADDTYDPRRIEQLVAMLRSLAERITLLDAEGRLLQETPSLLRELGEIRAELFRYEVRSTFDTPEVADNRRIVDQAKSGWIPGQEDPPEPDDEEEEPWRRQDKDR